MTIYNQKAPKSIVWQVPGGYGLAKTTGIAWQSAPFEDSGRATRQQPPKNAKDTK
jgi:hypothetical protein